MACPDDLATFAEVKRAWLEVQPMTREEFVQIVSADLPRWARVIKTLGIKGE